MHTEEEAKTTDRIFDVTVVITKTVRVRVPAAVVNKGESYEDVAEEFGEGGKSTWPEYVLSEEEDRDVEMVTEVTTP